MGLFKYKKNIPAVSTKNNESVSSEAVGPFITDKEPKSFDLSDEEKKKIDAARRLDGGQTAEQVKEVNDAISANENINNKKADVLSLLGNIGIHDEGERIPNGLADNFSKFDEGKNKGVIVAYDDNGRLVYFRPGKVNSEGFTDYEYGLVYGTDEEFSNPIKIGSFLAKAPKNYTSGSLNVMIPKTHGELTSRSEYNPIKTYAPWVSDQIYGESSIPRIAYAFSPIDGVNDYVYAKNMKMDVKEPVEKNNGGLIPLNDDEKEIDNAVVSGMFKTPKRTRIGGFKKLSDDEIISNVKKQSEEKATDIKNRVIQRKRKVRMDRKADAEQPRKFDLKQLADSDIEHRTKEYGAKEVAGYPTIFDAMGAGYTDKELKDWGNSVLDGQVLRSESISDLVNTRFRKAVKERSSL